MAWVVELTGYDPSEEELRTLRFTSGEGIAFTDDEYAESGLMKWASASQKVDLSDAGEVSFEADGGELSIANLPNTIMEVGPWDHLVNWIWQDKPAVLYWVPALLWADRIPVARGVLKQPIATLSTGGSMTSLLRFPLRDPRAALDVPLQGAKFLGDNAGPVGVEGDESLKGRPKPIVYGLVSNISPPVANASLLIFMVADKPVGIVCARDGGISLTFNTTRASLAAMQANDPPGGTYDVYAGAEGTFIRTGGNQVFNLTVDADEALGVEEDRSHARIWQRFRDDRTTSTIDTDNVEEIHTLDPYEAGYYFAEETTVKAALEEILAGGACFDVLDMDDVWYLRRIGLPAGNGAVQLEMLTEELEAVPETRLIQNLTRVQPNYTPNGAPPYRVNVRWGHNYTIMDKTSFAGSADPRLVEKFSTEWPGRAFAEDLDIWNPTTNTGLWTNAPEFTIETGYQPGVDGLTSPGAQALADDLLEMFSVLRGQYTVDFEPEPEDALLPGDTVQMRYPGFGLASGANFTILQSGFQVDAEGDAHLGLVIGLQTNLESPGLTWTEPYPSVYHTIASVASSGGRHMANEFSATPPSNNLFTLTVGDIRSLSATGITVVKVADLGPSGTANESVRVTFNTTAGAFIMLNDVIPADPSWILDIMGEGVAVGTTNVRRGSATSLVPDTVVDTSFKSLPRLTGGIASDGLAVTNYQIRGDATTAGGQVKLARLRGYKSSELVDWADEPPPNHHVKKRLSYPGIITVDANGEIIMTGGVNHAYQLVDGNPTAKPISDAYITFIVDATGGAANTRIWSTETATDLSPATTASTLYGGTADADGSLATGPVNTGANGANVRMKNAGPTAVSIFFRDGFSGVFVDGMLLNVVDTNRTEFFARLFQMFGTSAGAGAVPGTFIADVQRFNQAPTIATMVQDLLMLQQEHAAAWARGGTRNKLFINGDSNGTAGLGGFGAFLSQGDLGYHTRPLYVANRALSGSTLVRMKMRWDTPYLDTASSVAMTWPICDRDAMAASVAAGNHQIYGFNTSFANDSPRFVPGATVQTLIDDTLAWADEIAEFTGERALLWGPIGLQTATASQLTARDTYETQMQAAHTAGRLVYASNAATTLWTWNVVDFYDDKHIRTDTVGAGHDKGRVVVHDAMDTAGMILP